MYLSDSRHPLSMSSRMHFLWNFQCFMLCDTEKRNLHDFVVPCQRTSINRKLPSKSIIRNDILLLWYKRDNVASGSEQVFADEGRHEIIKVMAHNLSHKIRTDDFNSAIVRSQATCELEGHI